MVYACNKEYGKLKNKFILDMDLLYFNSDYIEDKIKKLTLKNLSDEEEPGLAFWLYQNEHYIQSYNALKRVSKNAFK